MKSWNKWYLSSGILQLACCIRIFLEWLRYSDVLNSAPFWVTILVNAVAFGVPAAICFLIGYTMEKRYKKRKDDSHEFSN